MERKIWEQVIIVSSYAFINSPVLLYSDTISPRLKYITAFIGKQIQDKEFELTSDKGYFSTYTGGKINYSKERISAEEFWISSTGLLFEQDIHAQDINCFDVDGNIAFFKSAGDYPFDVFAASFYLLSRYEEYLPHKKDMYGRYAFENSLAYNENFLHLPLVNLWLQDLQQKLKEKFSSTSFTSAQVFSHLLTYDIDEAFSYKRKPWWRTAGGFIRAIINGDWVKVNERLKVLADQEPDPYDAYQWMDELHKQYNLQPFYFFLVAEKPGRYDKNISTSKKSMQELIQHHAELYNIGIHPSWQSGDNIALLRYEILKLGHLTGKQIINSRQHYIRFDLPSTFRQLIDAGIVSDYSMGYGSINGFRASVTTPFYWYDLEKNYQTSLMLYPFCFMDANSFFEQKFSSHQALNEMLHYYNAVKIVDGMLITIWHNTFLGSGKHFKGWKEIYKEFIARVHKD